MGDARNYVLKVDFDRRLRLEFHGAKVTSDVDGDGDREIVYDRDGCAAKRGPIVCVDGRTGKLVRQWIYARPGKDHLQRATLGDFDPSRPGLELAGVGKRRGRGGLILWSGAGGPAWRKDIPAGWVTWGDRDGDGRPEIMPSIGVSGDDGWEVWTGGGKRACTIAWSATGGLICHDALDDPAPSMVQASDDLRGRHDGR